MIVYKDNKMYELYDYMEFLYDNLDISKKEMNDIYKSLLIKIEDNDLVLIDKDRGSGITTFLTMYCMAKFNNGSNIIYVAPNIIGGINYFKTMINNILESLDGRVKTNYSSDINNRILYNNQYKNFFKVAGSPEEVECMKHTDIILFDDSCNNFFNDILIGKDNDDTLYETVDENTKIIMASGLNLDRKESIRKLNFFKEFFEKEKYFSGKSCSVHIPWYSNEKNCRNLRYEKFVNNGEYSKFTVKNLEQLVTLTTTYDDFIYNLSMLDYMESMGWNLTSDYFYGRQLYQGKEELIPNKEIENNDVPTPCEECNKYNESEYEYDNLVDIFDGTGFTISEDDEIGGVEEIKRIKNFMDELDETYEDEKIEVYIDDKCFLLLKKDLKNILNRRLEFLENNVCCNNNEDTVLSEDDGDNKFNSEIEELITLIKQKWFKKLIIEKLKKYE